MGYGKPIDYGKIMTMIIVLIGAILFTVSAFVHFVPRLSLIDLYGYMGLFLENMGVSSGAAVFAIGLLITGILHPITMALGFLSVIKLKLTRVAGILGIISCAMAIMAVSALKYRGLGYGVGIWVGLAGAIILIISNYIGKMISAAVSAGPPPPPPGVAPTCPTCGQPLTYVQQYGRWYCQYCRRYT